MVPYDYDYATGMRILKYNESEPLFKRFDPDVLYEQLQPFT